MADIIDKKSLIDQIDALTVDGELTHNEVNYLINYLIANGNLAGSPRDMIQIRRGNKANLPNLAQGEMAITLDEERVYVGGVNGNIPIPNEKDIERLTSAEGVNVMFPPHPLTGAVGDGVTNDTLAIQAIINYALENKRIIYLPTGTYLVDDLIVDTIEGLVMYGDKNSKSVLLYNGTNYCLTLKNSTGNLYTYSNFISDIFIKFTQNAKGGLSLQKLNESTLKNVLVQGQFHNVDYGFHIQGTQITKLEGCVASNVTTGFYINGGENINIVKSNIFSTESAFIINYCLGLYITDNWIENFQNAFYIKNDINTQLENVVVERNSFWQTGERIEARILKCESINNINLYVNASFSLNTFYFPILTTNAFEFISNNNPYYNLFIKIDGNTGIGITKPILSDTVNLKLEQQNNKYSSALHGVAVHDGGFDYVKRPIKTLTHSTEVVNNSHQITIPMFSIGYGQIFEVRLSGKMTSSVNIKIDDDIIETINGTFFDGKVKIVGLDGKEKLIMFFTSDSGDTLKTDFKWYSVHENHVLTIYGAGLEVWDSEVLIS